MSRQIWDTIALIRRLLKFRSKPKNALDRILTTSSLPSSDDRSSTWQIYWQAQGQPWRTEPEIDAERQKYLAEHRAIKPDIERGIYPFKDVVLSRADVEWLLATHENGRGPVDWDDTQRRRESLDLRGADLRRVDLQGLPLSRMRGGLTPQEWNKVTAEQREIAAIHLEGAHLWAAQLNEASLRGAHFEGAILRWIHLEGAALGEAHLEGANLHWGRLQGAFLQAAHLEGADLQGAHLEGANLKYAYLEGKLTPLNILGYMQRHDNDFPPTLSPANLQLAFFDSGTNLSGAILGNKEYGFVTLADAHWSDTNLAIVKWSQVDMLGDEYLARQKKHNGRMKDQATRLKEYEAAVRANRQLTAALRNQGLNEEAASFAYRAQVLQKRVFCFQMLQHETKLRRRGQAFGAWLFSWFFSLLAGYGYKPLRSFLAYLLIIAIFAAIYSHLGPHLAWNEAIVISMTAFHGRGFFPDQFKPGDPQALVAAIEAFVGLIIEVTFIATLTQRLFGK